MWKNESGAGLFPGWDCLFLANCMVSCPALSGGDKHFIEVARRWRSNGLSLSVMTTDIGKRNCLLEGFDGPFVLLPGERVDNLGIMPAYAARMVLALFKMPWRKENTLLYGTSDFLPDVLPAFLGRVFGRGRRWVQCVFHLVPHPRERGGSGVVNTVSYVMQRLSLALIRRRADLVIVDNSTLRSELVSMGFSPDKILVTVMGADRPVVREMRPATYDGCFLGRLHVSKGVFELVDIWKRVCERRPGSSLAMVGADPLRLRGELEKKIRALGLEGAIHILGYLPGAELEEVLSSSRVFVFPSHEEGFGISLLEAMKHGVPAVAFGLPHYREIFGDAIITVEMGDVERFADEVGALLEDEERCQRMAVAGRTVAGRYSWERTADLEAEAICAILPN